MDCVLKGYGQNSEMFPVKAFRNFIHLYFSYFLNIEVQF